MINKFKLIFIFTISFVATHAVEYKYYKANSPQIKYVGRVMADHSGAVSFDWSGTYINVVVDGGYLDVEISDTGNNYFNVYVDGEKKMVFSVRGDSNRINILSEQSVGPRRVMIQKRTEGEQGVVTIKGFYTFAKGALIESDRLRSRPHIEFIGNSLTCGYGSEGKCREEPFSIQTENCDISYAVMISRYFDADYTLISHSGHGAARNYGDSLRVSKYTMRDRMLNTFDTNCDIKWNFVGYRPDLVVINLGSNDFSTKPHPTRDEFTESYRTIIEQLRQKYGDVKIFCVGPRIGGYAYAYIHDLCKNMKDGNLYFGAALNGVYNNTTDMGASWHPNYNGHRKIAITLIPFIATIMDWELNMDRFELLMPKEQ